MEIIDIKNINFSNYGYRKNTIKVRFLAKSLK